MQTINDSGRCIIVMKTETYFLVCLEVGDLRMKFFSEQTSISCFRTKRHSRNVEKKGWWLIRHRDVRELRFAGLLFRNEDEDGESADRSVGCLSFGVRTSSPPGVGDGLFDTHGEPEGCLRDSWGR